MNDSAKRYTRITANYRYYVWLAMIARCTRPTNRAWPSYGGRGITVCARWLNSFESFVDDMGDRPSPDHSLDRINNDLGYSPDNCRWATRVEQARNRRLPRERKNIIRVDGLSLTALSKIHGINRATLKLRYKLGRRGNALIARDLRNSCWQGRP
jgi:hypothetical protein